MIPEVSEECAELEKRCHELGYEVVYISAYLKEGLKKLVDKVAAMLSEDVYKRQPRKQLES